MLHEQLTQEELQIERKITGWSLLKGLTLPEDTVYWATKLASLVDNNASPTPLYHEELYERLWDCLFFEARAHALPKPSSDWEPESIEAVQHAHAIFMNKAADEAHQAVDVAAQEKGVRIDSRDFVRKDINDPGAILQVAYHALALALAAQTKPPSL